MRHNLFCKKVCDFFGDSEIWITFAAELTEQQDDIAKNPLSEA